MDSTKTDSGPPHEHADTHHGTAEAYCPSCESSYTTDFDTCPNDGARLVQFAADKSELTGRVLDNRFEIRERLGSGGMGTVYRALQTSVGRDVAVKVIHPQLSRERSTAKRFLREAKLSSRLSQMNTVVVHDFGQTRDGMLYLVMEMLRGKTLRAIVAGTEGLPLSRVKRIGIQLSDALHAAGELGIVHRDLKPSNIIILDKPAGRDRVKVLDFGLAKSLTNENPSTDITKSGALMGTPLYMAPEVIAGEEATPQSDLYALGCILYEMVCGKPPFEASTLSALFGKHITEEPAPLGLTEDPDLEQLIMALLSKFPKDRPSSASDVHVRLGGETLVREPGGSKRAAAPLPGPATISGAPTLPAATVPDVALPPKRNRVWIAAVVLVLAVGGGAIAWTQLAGKGQDGVSPSAAPPPAANTIPATTKASPAPDTPAAVPVDAATAVAPTAATESIDAGVATKPASKPATKPKARVSTRRKPRARKPRPRSKPTTTPKPPVSAPTPTPTPKPAKPDKPPDLEFVD